jgi:hypothetical protein
MRKDFYEQSSRTAKWMKRSNILYFFMAWNAFGICVYQWYTGKRGNQDPNWNRMSMSQKYVSMMSYPESDVTVVDIKGVSSIQTRSTSVEEFLATPSCEQAE